MTYIDQPKVTFADGPTNDAFSRVRVSNPESLFYSFNEYKINPFDWETFTVGTGSVSHSTTTKRVTLSTGGTASGARAVLQSHQYLRYTPGRSLFPAMTFVMGATVTNADQIVGYGDDSNGIFIKKNNTGIYFVRRSSVSGSVVDTAVAQASWGVDKFDGTGPSGLTLDMTKGQILWIDLQFLGVGRVRMGFDINGVLLVAHEFNHANITSNQPFMATANLPIRYEVVNTGIASGTATIDAICAKVDLEGASDVRGVQYSASTGGTAKTINSTTVATRIPILSIRPGPTYNGITNRGHIIPVGIEIFCETRPMYWELVLNGTLTGASWTAVNVNAMGQFDTSATAITAGTGVVITSGYVNASAASSNIGDVNTFSKRPLCNDYAGTTPDHLTLCAVGIGGVNGTAYGSITWHGQW